MPFAASDSVPPTWRSCNFGEPLPRKPTLSLARRVRRLCPDRVYFVAWLLCCVALLATAGYLQLVTFPEMQALRAAVSAAKTQLPVNPPHTPVELRCPADTSTRIARSEAR